MPIKLSGIKKPPLEVVLQRAGMYAYAFNRLEKSIRIGVATHNDE